MERKTKVEIINDLLKYNLGNRSVVVNDTGKEIGCYYTNPEGNHCAVGQYLKPEYQVSSEEEIDYDGKLCANDASLNDLFVTCNHNFNNILVEEVHGHNLEFWQTVQDFHDDYTNFTETGLSEVGQERHQKLLINWELATFEDGKSEN